MRTYDRSKPAKAQSAQPTIITAATPLVNVATAADRLLKEKGIRYSQEYIRQLCRSGRWVKGTHWTKHGRYTLINLEAVYQSIAGQ